MFDYGEYEADETFIDWGDEQYDPDYAPPPESQSATLLPHNAHRYPSQHPLSQTNRTSTRDSNYGTGIKITFYNYPPPLPACGRRVWADRRRERERSRGDGSPLPVERER